VRWPRLAQLLDDAEDEVLTYLAFPGALASDLVK
jgi:hypothetical protein